jgi:hypothetical protein
LSDACSTSSPAYITKAIHEIVRRLHGFVASSDALMDSISSFSLHSNATSKTQRSSHPASPSTNRKGN